MKMHPITNGTPDKSLDFIVRDGSINTLIFAKTVLGDGWEDLGYYIQHEEEHGPYGLRQGSRVTIFGPAFERLVGKAGRIWTCDEPCLTDGCPDEHSRFRTAAELTQWLEDRLNE